MEPPADVRASLRNLPRYLGPSTAGAALVAALLAFTGPAVLVVQAAANAGLSAEQTGSWILAIAGGGGLASLILALAYRQPICGAWSIAGAALLVSTLPRFTLGQAVGAYLVSGLLIIALGLSGLFGRVMERMPQQIVMGMLGGVLFRFGVGIFAPITAEPVLVLGMVLTFLVVQHLKRPAPALAALLVGTALAAIDGRLAIDAVSLGPTTPRLVPPALSTEAVLSLSLPLTLLALTSQNAPGIGIL